MNPVYVKNEGLAEREFFRRELGLNMLPFVNLNDTFGGSRIAFACTDPRMWATELEMLPKESIIFFLLGNERYDEANLKYLNNFKSLKHVFIHNPPRRCREVGLFSVLGQLSDLPRTLLEPQFYRAWKNAFDFARRSRRIELYYSHSPFPQGYSNRYVFELGLLNLAQEGDNTSLTTLAKLQRNSIPNSGIGFMGQKGSWQRSKLIEKFLSMNEFNVLVTDGWGGLSQGLSTSYAENILENRATLHLPGNISNQSCRYLEVLLLGRLPITPPYTFQDHHYSDYWTERLAGVKKWSYKLISEFVLDISDIEYQQILTQELERVMEELELLKSEVTELLVSR